MATASLLDASVEADVRREERRERRQAAAASRATAGGSSQLDTRPTTAEPSMHSRKRGYGHGGASAAAEQGQQQGAADAGGGANSGAKTLPSSLASAAGRPLVSQRRKQHELQQRPRTTHGSSRVRGLRSSQGLRSPEPPPLSARGTPRANTALAQDVSDAPSAQRPTYGGFSLPAELYEFDKALTGMDTWPATGVAVVHARSRPGTVSEAGARGETLTSEQLAAAFAEDLAEEEAQGLGAPEDEVETMGALNSQAFVRASKPRFLSSLEDFLEEGLRKATREAVAHYSDGGTDGSVTERGKPALSREAFRRLGPAAQAAVVDARLGVAAECLSAVCRAFTTYGPLLARCKAAYDARMALAKRDAADVTAGRERLAVMRAERDAARAEASAAAETADSAWAAKMDRAERRIAELEATLEPVTEASVVLRRELGAAKAEMETLESSRRTLFSAVQNNEAECRATVARARKETDEHRDAKEIAQETTCRLEDKVKALETEQKGLREDLEAAKEQGDSLLRELSAARQRLAARATEADGLRAELAELTEAQRAQTPRPEWHALAEQHHWTQYERAMFSSHRTSAGVRNLFMHIADARAEKMTLLKQIKPDKGKSKGKRLGKMKKKGQDDSKNPWDAATWTARGTSDAVPRFLRASGKIKNRKLSKKDCEGLVREMWEARTSPDGATAGDAMDVFLYSFLESKYKGAAAAVEMGYNLVFAMERYIEDADVELAYKVVMGMLPEEMYKDQQESVEAVLSGWRALDTGSMGVLSRDTCIQALRCVFAEKTDTSIAGLEYAASADQPGNEPLAYEKLFADIDDEMNQGFFAELLRDQHLEERERYLEDLEGALRTVAAADGKVSVAAARRALSVVDPSKMSRTRDLNVYLARMYGVEETTLSLPNVEVPPVLVATLIEGLKRGLVKRGALGPPPHPQEVVKYIKEWKEARDRIAAAKEAARLMSLGAEKAESAASVGRTPKGMSRASSKEKLAAAGGPAGGGSNGGTASAKLPPAT